MFLCRIFFHWSGGSKADSKYNTSNIASPSIVHFGPVLSLRISFIFPHICCPRLPLVASCHRPAVLRQWASVCGGIAPREVLLDFRSVRSLSPAAFVDLLADQLAVKGVVAGGRAHIHWRGTVEPRRMIVSQLPVCATHSE